MLLSSGANFCLYAMIEADIPVFRSCQCVIAEILRSPKVPFCIS